MNVIGNQQALVYDLPRAGPRNFDKFFMKNYFAPKLAEFNYASAAVADIYRLPLDEITALEIVGENTSEGSLN